MKEKRDCKILQDLLPNYIENLTNKETNIFIEEHLKECNECQKVLENMKKDFKINAMKRDEKEVKYIKKYNSKLKLLRNIIIMIVVIFIVVICRKTYILTDLSNKASRNQNKSNYYLKLESYREGKMTIAEAYYKDEKSLVNITSYSQETGLIKQTLYKSGSERISLIDNGSTKIIKNTGDISVQPISFTSEIFLDNLFVAISSNINKVKLNGKKCYLIKDGSTEKFIDEETGFAIKMIDNENNVTVDYHYEYGVVKNENVMKPDITGYTEIE